MPPLIGRSGTSFNDILRSVAAAEGAHLVDVDAALTAASPNGLVGEDLIADWVHPNIRAHQIIGAAVADTARRMNVPAAADQWDVAVYSDPIRKRSTRKIPSCVWRSIC